MNTAARPTKVALLANKIDDLMWVVIVAPDTNQHFTIPCIRCPLGTLIKIKDSIDDGAETGVAKLTKQEVKEFSDIWKTYDHQAEDAWEILTPTYANYGSITR